MTKKKSVTEAEQVQAAQEPALLPGEAVQEVQTDAPPMPEPARDESPCQEAPAAEDTQEEDGAEPVCYRVSAPRRPASAGRTGQGLPQFGGTPCGVQGSHRRGHGDAAGGPEPRRLRLDGGPVQVGQRLGGRGISGEDRG